MASNIPTEGVSVSSIRDYLDVAIAVTPRGLQVQKCSFLENRIQYSGPPLLHIAQDFHGYISVVATSNFMF